MNKRKTLDFLETKLYNKHGDYMINFMKQDFVVDKIELAYNFIEFLQNNYCNVISERYNIDKELSKFEILSNIAMNRKCLLKGNEPDLSKAANILFEDYRSGKLGNISLETP